MLFPEKSACIGGGVAYIVRNRNFKFTFCFIGHVVIKIIGYRIGLWFVLHQNPFSVQGGGIGINTAQVVRNGKTEVVVIAQPLLFLKVFWSYLGCHAVLYQGVCAQCAGSGGKGAVPFVGFGVGRPHFAVQVGYEQLFSVFRRVF